MQITFEQMAEKLGVPVDSVGRKYRELNTGQPFDKYAISNGSTTHILSRFLDSRNPKTAKAAKRLLDEYLESSELKTVSNKQNTPPQTKPQKDLNWLAILPLPLLGLAASFGVYSFAAFFSPWWVAVIEASAFEFVYIGLAVQNGLTEKQRRSANWISVSAMCVSVLYNTAAGLFHRMPDLLNNMGLEWELFLSVLHGLPIPVLAYAVADLLLHQKRAAHD